MDSENAYFEFSELRSEIHSKFQYVDPYCLDFKHPTRNEFYGATDALLDTIEMLRCAKSLHAKSGEAERKLVAYGILSAIYVQQDSVNLLSKLVCSEKINESSDFSEIRNLRNQLVGHTAYTRNKTSSIPGHMRPGVLSFQIYGLPENHKNQFYEEDIDALIERHYASIKLPMKKILSEMDNFLSFSSVTN